MSKTFKTKWFEFTTGWASPALTYALAGYDDSTPHLQIYFIWGKLFIYLPWKHYRKVEREKTIQEKRKDKLSQLSNSKFKSKKYYDKLPYYDTDAPEYGFYFHMNQLGLKLGKKVKLYDLPWALDWFRTSHLKKDGDWLHETRGHHLDTWESKYDDILFIEKHPYKYITNDGTEQNCIATIKVREMEWRWKWFMWLKLTRKIRKSIDIDFSQQIGERVGSWKGGVLGCGYDIKKNETPLECLRRMEKERKFN